MAGHFVPNPPSNRPYVPSPVERQHYLFGLPSKPAMIARSSSDPWSSPTGSETYIEPKQFSPLGDHPLHGVWEDQVGSAMQIYLSEKDVQFSFLLAVRLGVVGQGPPSPVVMVGIKPDTLSAEDGLTIATRCKFILQDHDIQDTHVILYESEHRLFAGMFEPKPSSNTAHRLYEPISTSLGIPIAPAHEPSFEGTGGFFFIDDTKPDKLFMVTARHVLFGTNPLDNAVYKFCDGAAKRHVLLMGTKTFGTYCEAIEAAIKSNENILAPRRKAISDLREMIGEDDSEEDREDDTEDVRKYKERLRQAADAAAIYETSLKDHQNLLKDVTDPVRGWTDVENRILGHVVFSPPCAPDAPPITNGPEGGFTEDLVVVEVNSQMISKSNLATNAVDVGSVNDGRLIEWMKPNSSPFEYPTSRLIPFSGTISLEHISELGNDVIMVMKNGAKTGLTVGHLSGTRALVRNYFGKEKGTVYSKEIVVLSTKFGPFSDTGDSGSAVIDGTGRVCGLLTGGTAGHIAGKSDCTFVTPIDWIIERLKAYGFNADILFKYGED